MSRNWQRAYLVLIVLAVCVVVYGVAKANADVVGEWRMNEKHGKVLHDSSGHNLDGHRGRHVILNGHDHRFTPIERGVYQPGRIDWVPDSDRLDPGNKPFAVTVQFKWNRNSDNNLVQKGQGSPAGGLFKMKTTVLGEGQPPGQIKCLFRGSTGDSQVESYSHKRLDDGKWHTVMCRRTQTGTVMAIDGVQVDANGNDPGVISNDWPISIGGNKYCDSPDLECNYWWGRIGYVQWRVQR